MGNRTTAAHARWMVVTMSRTRMLKPGFFSNEELTTLSPFHRLCFAGLWTIADKKGRLEDRPKRIKLAVLPFDDVDIEGLLADLTHGGFIVRYQVDSERFIAIPTFVKHQNPHVREPDSTIPAPPKVVRSTGPDTAQGSVEHRAEPGNPGTGRAEYGVQIRSTDTDPEIRGTEYRYGDGIPETGAGSGKAGARDRNGRAPRAAPPAGVSEKTKTNLANAHRLIARRKAAQRAS